MALKIYTKQGDLGTTSLIGGRRVLKNDIQVNIYGNLDELNSHIGLLLAYLPQSNKTEHLRDLLQRVQKNIFTIGSFYSFDFLSEQEFFLNVLECDEIENLEKFIDQTQTLLPPLKDFIMPGGCVAAAQAHVARCICRRAERLAVEGEFSQAIDIHKRNLAYLNRLSDFLFVAARYLNLIEEKQ
ncbi:MAG: cob(I)yrinic acid a,c-diamide adenosyltransferase [Bacteroidales bacterium]